LLILDRKDRLEKRASDNAAFSLSLYPWSKESLTVLFSEWESPTLVHN
jgi:hypothetical protein